MPKRKRDKEEIEEDQPQKRSRNANTPPPPPIAPYVPSDDPFMLIGLEEKNYLDTLNIYMLRGSIVNSTPEAVPINSENIRKALISILDYLTFHSLIDLDKGGILFKLRWTDENQHDHYFAVKEVQWNNNETGTVFNTDYIIESIIHNYEDGPLTRLKSIEGYTFQEFTGFEVDIIRRGEGKVEWSQSRTREWIAVPGDDVADMDFQMEMDEDTGFCQTDRGKYFYKNGYVLHSAKSKNGQCFFACIEQWFQTEKKKFYSKKWKSEIKNEFPDMDINGFECSEENLEKVAKYYNINIEVYKWNFANELFLFRSTRLNGTQYTDPVKILLDDAHYVRYIRKAYREKNGEGEKCPKCNKFFKKEHECRYAKCGACGRFIIKKNMDNHECNINNSNFMAKMEAVKYGKERLFSNVQYLDELDVDKHTIIFDLETHTDPAGKHLVYACGWYHDKTYQSSYGYNCLEKFMHFLKFLPKAQYTVIGYNNAHYDNNFIVSYRIKHKLKTKIVNNNGSGIITIQWTENTGAKIKFIDLLKFYLTGSLKNNCKAFNLPIQKGDFPYDFLNEHKDISYEGPTPEAKYWKELPDNFTIVDKWNLKKECLAYLKLDVMCTYELYKKFATTMFETYHVDMRNFLTLSNMSFEVWSSFVAPNTNLNTSGEWKFDPNVLPRPDVENCEPINIPNAGLFEMIYAATYGGRTFPWKRFYEHPDYEKIMRGEMTYEQIVEFIIQLDVVSQYPAAMERFEYPVGKHRIATEEEIKALNQIKVEKSMLGKLPMGIFKVNFEPNRKLVTPVLPRKEVKTDSYGRKTANGLTWDLTNGEGTYTSIDLEMALESGYKIEFLEGVIWEKKGYVFKNFINLAFAMKVKGEQTGNEALRLIAKIFMNSLYGKMLQKPILDELLVVTNKNEADKFISTKTLTDVVWFKDLEGCAIFKGVNPEYETAIRKPAQFGAFILSYSRRIIYDYMDVLDPLRLTDQIGSLKNAPFYTDTDSLHWLTNTQEMERIKHILSPDKLGYMWNDDKKTLGKVIRAIYLGPKCYLLTYIGKDNKIVTKMKSAGVPYSMLTAEMYEKVLFDHEEQKPKFKEGFKKTLASNWNENDPFQVISYYFKRQFLKSLWEGRFFLDDEFQSSLPYGYE
jgi:hypothetical protein